MARSIITVTMWMLPALPTMSWFAVHGYYRVTRGGAVPPASGPELIVANHTNSLLDVAFVVVASRRRVRFMAKAPLFTYPGLGWLVKAVGSVPVYRRQDDPKLVAQNLDVFRDVYHAVARGDAVGIFPEGIAHSASGLQPLKTGAARIALGAAAELGGRAFPIVPIGMVFRDRRAFRSSARVVVGEACAWDDLASRGASDREAVRELTRRIAASMRAVTLNLHAWQDEQLVRMAELVWRAERGGEPGAEAELSRLAATTDALARLRLGDDGSWRQVARQVRAHERILGRLGLTPAALRARMDAGSAAAWLARRLPMILMTPIAALGLVLFWIPRALADVIGTRASVKEGEDSVPTFRVMYGGVIFLVWFLLLAAAAGALWGALAAVVTFVALPLLGLGALAIGDSRRFVWQSVRQYFALRRHPERVEALRRRQGEIARHLDELLSEAGS
ncbi:MAG: 1-acyl-sn-glycerol-3-phosphate acyltransferase [Gemmatimonadaceae bacterium]|nr:1-acyl-sn-glycerol-3-phosphate acyltransferase [Gemmatimonadaceae bacterium]